MGIVIVTVIVEVIVIVKVIVVVVVIVVVTVMKVIVVHMENVLFFSIINTDTHQDLAALHSAVAPRYPVNILKETMSLHATEK